MWCRKMKLDKIELLNFRSYSHFYQEFDPEVNLIIGENAQGKTNLLEAIYYLAAGRAFRTRKEAELVRIGAEFAEISGEISGQRRTEQLKAVLFSGRKQRQLYRNGVKKRGYAELSGALAAVLFCPEDLMILKEGAAARRRLLDQGLCQLRPRYEAALQEYGRVIDQKARILRDRFENPSLLEILPEYNKRLCQLGAIIIFYRARYLQGLGNAATECHRIFSGQRETLQLSYRTVSTVLDPMAPMPSLEESLQEHLESHRRAELETAQCLTGPHKDDFDVSLDGLNLKSFGSQGQVRTAAISLKLAQRTLIHNDMGEEPVLLLDDVLSELDAGRQDFVLNQIRSGQVFITCCEPGRTIAAGKTILIQHKEARL